MSDSVRPHRRQPTRLPHPWDSPGKNPGVGCHFLSNAWKWKVKVKLLSHVRLLATPWTAAHQAPPSMEFSRQEYWSGVPLPSPFNFEITPKVFFWNYTEMPASTLWSLSYLSAHSIKIICIRDLQNSCLREEVVFLHCQTLAQSVSKALLLLVHQYLFFKWTGNFDEDLVHYLFFPCILCFQDSS